MSNNMEDTLNKPLSLTSALEDYLETIYELVRDNKLARVRDIARARGVRSASVSPAMRRLSDLGLIRYVQREYIDLTEIGEEAARRIYARHQLLSRFFHEILQIPADAAAADACAMEHSLSDLGMDHLVRFFEFMHICPEGHHFLDRFRSCPQLSHDSPECNRCSHLNEQDPGEETKSIAQLKPGDRARVTQVSGTGAVRQRLLDMGILPDVCVEVERVAPAGDPIWIKLQGFQLSLRIKEASSVLVVEVE